LTQGLTQVYTDPDPRAYPLSSYIYMIFPKSATASFSTDKGRTLSEFAYYFLCEGQQQAAALGYAPLPVNLVQTAVDQVNQIPGATQTKFEELAAKAKAGYPVSKLLNTEITSRGDADTLRVVSELGALPGIAGGL